jgi:hypothetical protein
LVVDHLVLLLIDSQENLLAREKTDPRPLLVTPELMVVGQSGRCVTVQDYAKG